MALTLVNYDAQFANTTVTSVGYASNFPFTPTAGNLLVFVAGGRDADNTAFPDPGVFSTDSDWFEVDVSSPMEYHFVAMAWKIADGGELGQNLGFGSAQAMNSRWWAVFEFSDPDVTTWQLDKSAQAGSGTTNVSSIASGSTGALSSGTGVAVVAGTSRTGSEGLSFSGITGLQSKAAMDALDADMFVDAGSANFGVTYVALSGTSALEATVSESNGSSRMGIVLGVFNDAAGGPTTVTGTAAGTISASGSASGSATQGVTTGTATGTISASGSAAGSVIEGVTTATASGTITAGGVATATPTQAITSGTASGSIAVSGSAAGTVASGFPLTDSFTYSDGALNTVSSSVWLAPFNTIPTVSAGALAVPVVNTVYSAIHQTSLGSPNHYVSADVTIGADYSESGVIARSDNTAATYYRATWIRSNGGQYQIYKRVAGTYTVLWTSAASQGYSGTRNIRLEVVGSSLRLLVDDVEVHSMTDSSITAGNYAGVEMYRNVSSTAVTADNWEAGPLAGPVLGTASGTIAASGAATGTVAQAVTTGTAAGLISVAGTALGPIAAPTSIFAGTVTVDAVYIGSTAVDAIYVGSTQVF